MPNKINETYYPIRYFDDYGKYHREDGPAIELANGHKEYWINGKLHREDGPAIIYKDGSKFWYINDKLHRIDGPAVICPDGYVEYWINGKRYYSLEEGLMDYVLY